MVKVINPINYESLDDMLKRFYGFNPLDCDVIPEKLSLTRPDFDPLRGTLQFYADAVTSGEAGYLNTIYGAIVSRLFYTEVSTMKLLGSTPWNLSAFRTVVDRGTRDPLGYQEGTALPDPGKSTVEEKEVPAKSLVTTYEQTLQYDRIAPTKDSIEVTFNRDEAKDYAMSQVSDDMLRAINVSTGYDVTSLYKCIASYDEVNNNVSYGATDANLYAGEIDRSGGPSAYDCQVIENGGVAQTFTEDMLKQLIDDCSPYWDDKNNRTNKYMITGSDTARFIDGFFADQQRFNEWVNIEFTRNGVTTTGRDTGFRVKSYDGIPIFVDQNALPSTIGDLSQLLLLDGDYITWETLVPWTNVETNFDKDMLLKNKMSKSGMFYTLGETWITKFKGMGKLTDLNST